MPEPPRKRSRRCRGGGVAEFYEKAGEVGAGD